MIVIILRAIRLNKKQNTVNEVTKKKKDTPNGMSFLITFMAFLLKKIQARFSLHYHSR